MRLGRSNRPKEATVDLTSMVDVVLLLVVFFVLTTQFARQQQTELSLPEQPGEKAREASHAAMIIDMTSAGEMLILGEPMNLEQIRQSVEREHALAGDDFEIIVRADRAASASHLNAIADTLARAGIRHWQLATASQAAPPPAGGGS